MEFYRNTKVPPKRRRQGVTGTAPQETEARCNGTGAARDAEARCNEKGPARDTEARCNGTRAARNGGKVERVPRREKRRQGVTDLAPQEQCVVSLL